MAGPSLGTAYVQVVASAQGIKGSITNAISGEASSAGGKAGSLISGKIKGAIAAAGIGTALAAGFKAAIEETGQLQQSYLGGIDTLYGEAADKAREYARAAQEAGISQRNYSEQAVSFGAALKQAYGGDTTQALEAANKAILDMADNSAKMGTPLQSIQDAYQGFAKQNYTMLDNLKLGYGGTKTEMERLLADAQKISGVEYDISNLGDVYDAIHVIQGELGLTGVAAEEAKSTLTGSFEGMKAAWDNLIGNIGLGENVGESMQTFTDALSNYFFNNLIPTIGTIIQSLPSAFSAFMQTGMPQLVSAGMGLVKSLADGAKKQFPIMVNNLFTSLVGLSGKLLKGASKFVDVGLSLILNIANGIIKNIPTFIQTVPTIITNLANIINKNAPKIVSVGFTIIKNLVVGVVKAIPLLVQNFPKILQAAVAVFKAFQWANLGKLAVKGITKGIKALGNQIKTALTKPIQTAKDSIKKIIDKVKGFFPLSIGKIFSNLKIPHISIKGGKAPYGIGGFGTKPSISVSWHAKAMENPYLFSNATLFGAGEKGDEVLYGRSALMRDISEATGNGGEVIINLNYDASDDANDMLRDLVRGVKRYRMAGVI